MGKGVKDAVCELGDGTRFMGCVIWDDSCKFGPQLPGEPDEVPVAMLCRSECIMS